MINMQKKVLYIVEADLTSGSGKCALELIQELKETNDFEPIVITQYQSSLNNECDSISVKNYAVHYARTCSFGMGFIGWFVAFLCRPFLNFYSYKKLAKKIDFKSIDLIHSNSSTIDFGAYLYKKLHIPHMWHVRDFLVFDRLQKPIIYNLPNYIVQNSSQIITVSNQLNAFLKSKTQCRNIKTIYDGVYRLNVDRIGHPQFSDSNKLHLVCVGNYSRIKGQDTLLDAIALLPAQVQKNIFIDFYGADTDGFLQELKTIACKNSIDHVVSFKGFCNSVFDILPNYEIGVQPSHTEGFSRVTVEYMLSGLCVVGNGDTAIQELIENGKTGLLYKDFDIQALADKIAYCFYSRHEIAQMGKNAQKVALEKYCIEKNILNIVDEYKKFFHGKL